MKLYGHIDDSGKLLLPDRGVLNNWISANKDKDVVLEVKVKRRKRSNEQNAYLWGVVYPMVCEGLRNLGHDVDEEDTHAFLKGKFNSTQVVNSDNVVEEVPTSTTKLNTVEMMDYIAKIQMWASEFLGVVIPDPNQQLTLVTGDTIGGTNVLIIEQK